MEQHPPGAGMDPNYGAHMSSGGPPQHHLLPHSNSQLTLLRSSPVLLVVTLLNPLLLNLTRARETISQQQLGDSLLPLPHQR